MAFYKCPKTKSKPALVAWSTGTDAQIKAMVDAYYEGTLTLDEIKSVWSVGDARNVNLSAMAADGVGESHVAQQTTFIILDFGNIQLTDNTECLAIVGQKNSLIETGYMGTMRNTWSFMDRRTWCNSVYKNAIPSDFRDLFKEHKTIYGRRGSAETCNDYFALAAETEIFGQVSVATAAEEADLIQFEYYKDSSHRYKKLGNNGPDTSGYYKSWWTRSVDKNSGNSFGTVGAYGSAGGSSINSNTRIGIAPFGVI